MRSSRPPTPFANTLVCRRVGSPVLLPRNSKSSSSWESPPDESCKQGRSCHYVIYNLLFGVVYLTKKIPRTMSSTNNTDMSLLKIRLWTQSQISLQCAGILINFLRNQSFTHSDPYSACVQYKKGPLISFKSSRLNKNQLIQLPDRSTALEILIVSMQKLILF